MVLKSSELNGSRVSLKDFRICGLNALLLDALLHDVKGLLTTQQLSLSSHCSERQTAAASF